MTIQARYFISYGREDGETFAHELYANLTDRFGEGAVWMDRVRMEGDASWWEQITNALDQVEYVILIATPAALKSPIVLKEYRYARKKGAVIYALEIPTARLNFKAIPPDWKKFINDKHVYSWEKQADKFISDLQKPFTREPVPFMAPALPVRYVPREREFNELKARIRNRTDDKPIAITTALKGAGGFGKTTLAAALCDDNEVRDAFDGGILWVTLGEDPDVVGAFSKLYRALTDKQASFVDIEDAITQLRDCFKENRSYFLVVDDVWDSAHLRPFLRGTGQYTLLITTRNAGIAARETQHSTHVDEMSDAQAVQLLQGDFAGLNSADLHAMALRLGKWPLMLEIAHGQLTERVKAYGDTPENALNWLKRVLDKRGILGIKRDDEDGRKRDAAGVLGVSLALLKPEERDYLAQLAVFKDDAEIDLSSVMALWGVDDLDTEDYLMRFAGLSLLIYASSTHSIRLHDVIREYLGTLVGDMAALHARLIAGWGDLTALPDTYAWRHVGYHLLEAGQAETLRAALLDYPYLQAKLNATDPNALIADCDLLLEDDVIRLIKSAVSMSAHVISEDPAQWGSQVVGRLMRWREKHADIRSLTDAIIQNVPGVYPINPDGGYVPLLQAGGALIRTLEGHTKEIKCVALSGEIAISGAEDGTLRVRNWQTGEHLCTLEGHTDDVSCVALSGEVAISGSADKTLRVWNWRTSEHLRTLEGHTHDVSSLALSGEYAVSASYDKTLRVWNWQTGEPLCTLEGHTTGIMSVALSGEVAISGSEDRTLRVWNWQTGEPLRTLEGHTDWVTSVALSGEVAISGSWDKTLQVWNWRTGEHIRTLEGHTDGVTSVALSGKYAISGSEDRTLRVWNWRTGEHLRTLEGHTGGVISVVLSGEYAISVSSDNTLRVWSWQTNGRLHMPEGYTGSVWSVALSGEIAISGSGDWTLRVWNWQTGEHLRALEGHTDSVNSVALSGEYAFSGSDDKTLRVWNWQTGEHIRTLEGHTNRVMGVALSGEYAISGSNDKTLRVWNWQTGEHLRTLEGHTDWVTSVALSGEVAISGSRDRTLRVWNWETGEHTRTLKGHTNYVNSVTLSGEYAISGSWDKTLRVWNWQTGEALGVYPDTDEGREQFIIAHPYLSQVAFAGYVPHESGWAVIRNSKRLVFRDPQGQTVGAFTAEANISKVQMVDAGTAVMAFDKTGRVLFLRWHPGKGQA